MSIFLCLATGLLFYGLLDIPFGFLFNMSFFLLIGSMLLMLLSLAIKCFRAPRRWVSVLGIPPLILSIILIAFALVITIDVRILFFQDLPPTPSKAEWTEDLHFLADYMEKSYPDLYASVPKIVSELR